MLALGLTDSENGFSRLLILEKDTNYPDIARASVIQEIASYFDVNSINDMLRFLKDDSPLVKVATLDVLGAINNTDYVNYFLPLIKDENELLE